jgi:hypothetical protein
MGLLDDAIREHLDLKRRHGADASEVARQEREAFGQGPMPPAPAAAEGGGPATAEHPPPARPDVSAEVEDVPDAPARRPFDDDVPGDDLPSASEALPGAGAVSAERFRAPADDDIDWSEPPPLDREPEPQAGPPERDEDVLEETPDFLQETPEHDRLWFEQRPPKDFDF